MNNTYTIERAIAREINACAVEIFRFISFWTRKNLTLKKNIHEDAAWVYHSVKRLAESTGYTRNQVEYAVQRLVSSGYIRKSHCREKRNTCMYTITINKEGGVLREDTCPENSGASSGNFRNSDKDNSPDNGIIPLGAQARDDAIMQGNYMGGESGNFSTPYYIRLTKKKKLSPSEQRYVDDYEAHQLSLRGLPDDRHDTINEPETKSRPIPMTAPEPLPEGMSPEVRQVHSGMRNHFGGAVYKSWFSKCSTHIDGDTLHMTFPNRFNMEYVVQHYKHDLVYLNRRGFGYPPSITFEQMKFHFLPTGGRIQ